MKVSQIIPITLLTVASLFGCKQQGESNASIKDNSNRLEKKIVTNDYSGIAPEELHKHVLAHYNLSQFEVGKEKLKYLISKRPDLIDSLELNKLQENFDNQLAAVKASEDSIIDSKRSARIPNATQNMRTINKGKTTYYVDNSTPKFDSKETFHAYYTKNKLGVTELRLKIKYIATEWLDIESYMVTVDQLDYDLKGDVEKVETKGKKKYKVETLDEVIDTTEELLLLEAIANGSQAKAVYIGKDGYKEREISKQQQTAIRNVLDAYLFFISRDMTDLKKKYAKR